MAQPASIEWPQDREDAPGEGAPDAWRRHGIVRTGPAVAANRRLNAWSIGLPMAGAVVALLLLGPLPPTATTAAVFLVFFLLELLGLGIGIHRYFTHQAFKTGRGLRTLLAVTASWAFQGPIDRWVADHRRHHRFADRRFDPHSPHWIGDDPTPSRGAGLWHAHLGWMIEAHVTDADRYAADIRSDPISGWCSRHYGLLSVSSIGLPAILGFVLGGGAEALRCALWAGFVRVAVLQQLTWSINSIGHSFGRQVEGARDESRDIPFLAVALVGEGLHSFHHRNPTAGVNEPRRLDPSGALLILLERWGWIRDLRRGVRSGD